MRILTDEVAEYKGKSVELAGWVHTRRDHGKIIFIDLRDRTGIVQLVFTPDKEIYRDAEKLRPEWVIGITGAVKARPKGMENPDIPTGSVEVHVQELRVLNESQSMPMPIDTDGYSIDENVRLKYRYLDLRRQRLQRNIKLRHRVLQFVRGYLTSRDFVEIETPLLTKSTPEGSRDFVVPSRLQPGRFYALPQSPQQYKQLLMTAGFERYFQIARALRDEDLRADRGFEHTQIDLEMSFVDREEVMEVVEGLMTSLFENFSKTISQKPFPRFSYHEAMKKFGSDKFDLRKNPEGSRQGGTNGAEEVALAWLIDPPVFVKDEKTGTLTYGHNPFTAPRPEDEEKLRKGKDLEALISLQYDLVANGHEIGGGGIRINKPDILKKVFEVLGHREKEIEEQFGHMLEAFQYGTPPHGGIALGLDRIMMILANEEYLREVVAFPMTAGGQTSVMDAPSEIDKEQLGALGLEIKKKK